MTKVKIFEAEEKEELENLVNEFIDGDCKVVDIKYTISPDYSECYSVLIIYN